MEIYSIQASFIKNDTILKFELKSHNIQLYYAVDKRYIKYKVNITYNVVGISKPSFLLSYVTLLTDELTKNHIAHGLTKLFCTVHNGKKCTLPHSLTQFQDMITDYDNLHNTVIIYKPLLLSFNT